MKAPQLKIHHPPTLPLIVDGCGRWRPTATHERCSQCDGYGEVAGLSPRDFPALCPTCGGMGLVPRAATPPQTGEDR